MYTEEIGSPPFLAKLTLARGDRWNYPVELYENVQQTQPLDITDAVVTAHVYKNFGEAPECALSVDVTDAENGQFNIVLDEADSANLSVGLYPKDESGKHYLVVRITHPDYGPRTIVIAFMNILMGENPL
jgi:hypothetical protein